MMLSIQLVKFKFHQYQISGSRLAKFNARQSYLYNGEVEYPVVRLFIVL